jgi:cytochrome c biogenesis protein CcmG, thiol:disulfide interchange protein DsbE
MTDLELQPDIQPVSQRGFGLGSIVLLFGIALVALIFGLQLVRQRQTQPASGPAPDFTITTLQGEELTLSQMKGKVVIINFWASWCGPCREEAPALQSIWEKYGDKGVVVLGVAYTDTESGAREFVEEFGQTYPNGMDLGTKISDKYHIQGVPETFIVDQDGNVAQFIFANVTEAGLTRIIDRLLGGAP